MATIKQDTEDDGEDPLNLTESWTDWGVEHYLDVLVGNIDDPERLEPILEGGCPAAQDAASIRLDELTDDDRAD